MNISAVFIERPVMATSLMAAFLLAGIFGYSNLPVSELPNVDFPTIDVSASLPGADAETMASSVAAPLEKQFSIISGVDSMTSTSGQGTTRITLQFRLDRNIDAAAQDVQGERHGPARYLAGPWWRYARLSTARPSRRARTGPGKSRERRRLDCADFCSRENRTARSGRINARRPPASVR
jgi:hypothetical protein